MAQDTENKDEIITNAPLSFYGVVKSLFKKSFNFKGREAKQSAILYLLFLFISFITISFFSFHFSKLSVLFYILYIFILIPFPSLIARRFHDHNKNTVFSFLPFILFILLLPNIDFNRLIEAIKTQNTSLENKWLPGGFWPELIFVLFILYLIIWLVLFFSKGNRKENDYGAPVLDSPIFLTKKFLKKIVLFFGILFILHLFLSTQKFFDKNENSSSFSSSFALEDKIIPDNFLKKAPQKTTNIHKNTPKVVEKRAIQPHPLFPELAPNKQGVIKKSLLKPIASSFKTSVKNKEEETPIFKYEKDPVILAPYDLDLKKEMIQDLKEVAKLDLQNAILRFLFQKSLESSKSNTPILAQEGDLNPDGILFLKAVDGNVFFHLEDEELYPYLKKETIFCENGICIFNPEEFLIGVE